MNTKMEEWHGFRCEEFDFKGRKAVIVFPNEKTDKWLFKTEYFGAFPNVETEMLKRGYHVAHVDNITRWNKHPDDTDIKKEFAEYITEKYGLKKKCVTVGMSCGGMQSIYFAAKYPEYVAAMYLDAPVINLLSCPACVGSEREPVAMAEFEDAMGFGLKELLSFRNHPLDNFEPLVKNNIPTLIVAGDSDTVVPYDENGALLEKYYKEHGAVIETIIKPGCDHHPHSLDDNTPIIDFILKYDK